MALFEDDQCLIHDSFRESKNHGKEMGKQLHDLLSQQNWNMEEVDQISLDIGPGAYTGLRVGVSFVKSMAYVLDIPVVPIKAPVGIAGNVPVRKGILVVSIKAYWNEYYVQQFEPGKRQWRSISQVKTISKDRIDTVLGEDTILVGNAISDMSDDMLDEVQCVTKEERWYPAADVVGEIALKHEEQHSYSREDLFDLQPLYLRPSRPTNDA